jgi:L-glutamine-phosphate cytidylyltransferase
MGRGDCAKKQAVWGQLVQALILAAGQGQRLSDRRGRPKCMREVAGVPLVHHQLAALAAVGVTDVVIVVGYEQEQIRRSVGDRARYVVNDRFAETNSMYSFMLGQRLIDDDVLVMNADVFCHPAMFASLREADGDALLYDGGSGHEDEQMKVHVERGYLVGMSKSMPTALGTGENVGILRLGAGTAADAAAAAAALVTAGREKSWLAAAINVIAAEHPIRCVDVAGWPWVEVDFPEDLFRARTEVLPAVMDALEELELEYAGAPSLLRSVS